MSADDVAQLLPEEHDLIWALESGRTDPAVLTAFKGRNTEQTIIPFLESFDALGKQHPVQTAVSHELILRDIIRDHARFLDFYGDRINPRDLYERSKHPTWIIPSPDFVAAIPPLKRITTDAEDTVMATQNFAGSLRLHSDHILKGHSAVVELGPVLEVLEDTTYDVTLDISKTYSNPSAQGALAIQVHRQDKMVSSIGIATSPPEVQVHLSAVSTDSSLTVSVVALKDNPRKSWAKAAQTPLRITVQPEGTHPMTNIRNRTKAWLTRVTQRRQLAA